MNKFIKLLICAIIISFLILFFSSSSGYYEYELKKKTNLTKDAIERFEQDIKDGKEIEFVAKDFFARVICHELDHLDGILIVDKAEE